MINRAAAWIRRVMLELAGNVSLFIFTAFLVVGILPIDIFKWHHEAFALVERYVVVPWGMALCLLRLERRTQEGEGKVHADAAVLFVLLAWIVVPFAIRFGVTFVNIRMWAHSAIIYFGVYLLLTEKTEAERGRLMDLSSWLFTLLALVWGGALLACAAAGISYGVDMEVVNTSVGTGGFGFGIFNGQHLCSGTHYNNTGMFAASMAMYCLSGMSRCRAKAGKLIHGAAFAMMTVVVVLTQSRTSRYALLAAFAAGVYGWFVSRKFVRNRFALHAAGIAAAVVVMVCSYMGMSTLTDAALRHYAMQRAKMTSSVTLIQSAYAQEEAAQQTEQKPEIEVPKARPAMDATFSIRTDLWRNLFKLWKENPRHFVIGNGVGRTGSRIIQGTEFETIGGVMVHNTYLQYIADFGLIGFGLLAVFMAIMMGPFMRVLFAPEAKGMRSHCMMVVIAVMTGLMESPPLTAMSPMNILLFYSLGQIMGCSRDLRSLV